MLRDLKKILSAIFGVALVSTSMPTVKAAVKEVKVLSIGHSYSLNSCEYLYDIAKSQGVEMTIGIAYRGNCPLRMHYEYLTGNVVYGEAMGGGYYKKYVSGGYCSTYPEEYTLGKMLKDEKWDYIIFQDCLDTAGDWDTVSEWLPKLYEKVDKIMREQGNTTVQYIYHKIWGMESTKYNPTDLVEFSKYNYDSENMYRAVSETSKRAADSMNFRLLPTGDAFRLARNTPEFDAEQRGKILVADTTNHANKYGQYLAGITWFETITQMKVDKASVYRPNELTESEANILIDCATDAVTNIGLRLTKNTIADENKQQIMEEKEEENKNTFPFQTVAIGVGIVVVIAVLVVLILKFVRR